MVKTSRITYSSFTLVALSICHPQHTNQPRDMRGVCDNSLQIELRYKSEPTIGGVPDNKRLTLSRGFYQVPIDHVTKANHPMGRTSWKVKLFGLGHSSHIIPPPAYGCRIPPDPTSHLSFLKFSIRQSTSRPCSWKYCESMMKSSRPHQLPRKNATQDNINISFPLPLHMCAQTGVLHSRKRWMVKLLSSPAVTMARPLAREQSTSRRTVGPSRVADM
ncbi:hypothetical protein BKA82DRAFT_904794 [Pisolithus tinctorius]|uniref:Uncharacterized protein n=1 Tax=Pisolithus tinctorius Marx 270 TaxID=870435 RepID=A0A0C3PPJ3_PISTI|nr:hypothetical protein BKA82DRAFT_904794 [Pisolithus tinctorius]KIO10379.1 hypothetical protein M404DRAFT_904794 [Pisolithus tinctorius Marx 270]